MIEFGNLKELIDSFGKEKIIELFEEFQQDALEKMEKTKGMTHDELRIAYHNLRSTSLVFGMTGFSDICKNIEDMILQNETEPLEKEIKNSKIVLKKDLKTVQARLKK